MLILQCQNRPAGMMQKDWSELEKWWHLIKHSWGMECAGNGLNARVIEPQVQ